MASCLHRLLVLDVMEAEEFPDDGDDDDDVETDFGCYDFLTRSRLLAVSRPWPLWLVRPAPVIAEFSSTGPGTFLHCGVGFASAVSTLCVPPGSPLAIPEMTKGYKSWKPSILGLN